MRVLVMRREGKPELDEVIEAPFFDWVSEDGRPLTEPCFGYALGDVDESLRGQTVASDYEIIEREVTVPGPTPDDAPEVKVYRTAVYRASLP